MFHQSSKAYCVQASGGLTKGFLEMFNQPFTEQAKAADMLTSVSKRYYINRI